MSFLDKILGRNRPKVGSIVYGERRDAKNNTKKDSEATPSDRLHGVIIPRGEQTYFHSYNGGDYITFDDYGQWPGMVCEAVVEEHESLLDPNLKGYAYKIFVRNEGNGRLYTLPSPEQMELFPKDRGCFCPFCIVEHFQAD